MRFAADNLSILLSCDWFIDAWPLCGLQSGTTVRLKVQQECRSIVNSIVDGAATYWDIDFSAARGARTKAQLTSVFDRTGVIEGDIFIFRRYLEGIDNAEAIEEGGDTSLIPTLCSLFVSEHKQGKGIPGQFSESSVTFVDTALHAMNSEQLIVEAGSATSFWDRRLLQLTPDLPSFTVDVARDLARHAGSIATLIGSLRTGLSHEEQVRLDSWLRNMAVELAGVHLSTSICGVKTGE